MAGFNPFGPSEPTYQTKRDPFREKLEKILAQGQRGKEARLAQEQLIQQQLADQAKQQLLAGKVPTDAQASALNKQYPDMTADRAKPAMKKAIDAKRQQPQMQTPDLAGSIGSVGQAMQAAQQSGGAGGVIQSGIAGAGAGAAMGSMLAGKAAATGTGKLAASGLAGGPAGALIGLGVGTIAGLLGARSKRKQREREAKARGIREAEAAKQKADVQQQTALKNIMEGFRSSML